VGRLRPTGLAIDPELDAAVDRVLASSEIETVEIELDGWDAIPPAFNVLIRLEAWASNVALLESRRDRVGEPVRSRLEACRDLDHDLVPGALAAQTAWRAELRDVFTRVQALVLPTLIGQPPELGADGVENALVFPWNVSGSPALSLPIPVAGWAMPGSLQIVGPDGSEELLCATGALLELAAKR
jgi:amidase